MWRTHRTRPHTRPANVSHPWIFGERLAGPSENVSHPSARFRKRFAPHPRALENVSHPIRATFPKTLAPPVFGGKVSRSLKKFGGPIAHPSVFFGGILVEFLAGSFHAASKRFLAGSFWRKVFVKVSRSLKKFGGKFGWKFGSLKKFWREVWVKVWQPQKVWREVLVKVSRSLKKFWREVSRSLKKTYPNIFYVIPSDYVANLSTCARFKIVDSG